MKKLLLSALILIACTIVFSSCNLFDFSKDETPAPKEKEYIYDAEDHWIRGESAKESHSFQGEVCQVCSFDMEYTRGIEYKLSHDLSYYYVDGYTGSSEIVVIEKEFNGVPVTSIMSDSFSHRSGIKKIFVPDSVTEIRMYAFAYCTDLEFIYIPDSVVNASGWLFTDCEKLSDIVFSDNAKFTHLESFTGTAYYNNKENWINGVLYVGKHLIKVDESYSGVLTIREGTETIAGNALLNCENLEKVIIPNTVRTIGLDAFSGCKSLKSIKLPNSVVGIASYAFKNCTSLEEVILSENLYTINNYAFSGCEKLTKIIIPASVVEMGEKIFVGCPNLVAYCRLSYRPTTWHVKWMGNSNEAHWGYTGE